MKTVTLWGLVGLNVMLLASFFGLRVYENAASGQAMNRRPGEYIMIDGQISANTTGVVYVVDTVNGQLTALTYGQQAGPNAQIESMPPVDLNAVFAQQQPPSGTKGRY